MKKVMLVIKNFFPTLKKYVDYLMKVGYKELFVNTVIILCLFVLAAFVYVPIGVLRDFLSDTIQLFAGGLNNTAAQVYYWIFNIISILFSVLVFMWLFNKRFETIENEKAEDKNEKVNKKKKEEKEDEFDLPKAKDK